MKKINFEKWFETYKPIANPIDKKGTYCGIDKVNYRFKLLNSFYVLKIY
jgi:hypothetical protein